MKRMVILFFVAFIANGISAQYYSNYNYGNNRNQRNYNYASYNDYSYSNSAYLPVNVRRKLAKLENKLADRKRCALEDGYISRREARRIEDVEREINQILIEYRVIRGTRNYGNNRICR